jgi:Transcription factor WhiB
MVSGPATVSRSRSSVCASCLVRSECLDYAMWFDDPLPGVLAGMTVAERVELRREQAASIGSPTGS